MIIKIDPEIFNDVYYRLIDDYSKDLIIIYGGASSGKSVFVAQRNIINLLKGNRNYLICRKVGDSLRNTAFAEYKKVINDFNLNELFSINNTDMTITTINGYRIIFKGLDKPEKLKSLIFDKGILTDIHIEEATDILEDDYNQLKFRLRGKYKNIKKQIIMTFNPILESHWIKKRFIDNIDDNVEILKTTYKDNKFLTEQDIRNIEAYREIDEYYFNVYALGNWGVLGNLVFHNWKIEDLTKIKAQLSNYSVGLDFGFTNDPSAIILTAFHNKKIYILKERYEKGLLNSDISKILKEEFKGYYIYADSSEPKSIQEIKLFGLPILAVKKGKDSIIHGIEWLKQYPILVDKSCVNTIREFHSYKYREDRDGNILNEPVDLNNHAIDGIRYSCEHLMISMKAYRNLTLNKLGI